jgi:NAD-dependent dihydropyrimidine dehydrogenase PreA subunit
MKDLIYLKNVVSLELYPDKCIGCGMCIDVCPHDVFAINNKKAAIINKDACMECGACQMNCPAAAISVDAGVGCAVAIINSALGIKSGGCACTIESPDNQLKNQTSSQKNSCC